MSYFKTAGNTVRLIIATVLTMSSALTIGLSSLGNAAAQTFNNGGQGCSIAGLMPQTNAFTVSGNTATTRVEVDGPASCQETVSLSSWKAPIGSPNFRPFEQQQFVAGKTLTLGPGMHTLSIMIDSSCSYQVDLVLGGNPKSPAGNANFPPGMVIGFIQVSNGVCQAPAPQPKPQPQPTPPPSNTTNNTTTTTNATNNVCSGNVTNSTTATASQGGNCSTNTTIVQNQAVPPPATPGQGGGQTQSQQANTSASAGTAGTAANASASQSAVSASPAVTSSAPATTSSAPITTSAAPASLVNTGPATIGGMIGLFVGVTLFGTLAYDYLLRRKLTV